MGDFIDANMDGDINGAPWNDFHGRWDMDEEDVREDEEEEEEEEEDE